MMIPFSRAIHSLSLVVLLGLLLPQARGQDEVSIKVLCFPRSQNQSTIELLVGDDEVIEIPLQAHEFTLPIKVPRQATWKFGQSTTNSEGNFTFNTHATAKPLPSNQQLLVFIRKGQKMEAGFNIVPLNPGRIKGRNYVLLNLTRGPISGMVGGERFRLPVGRRVILAPKADRGEDLCFATLRYQRNDKWRPFFSSNWRLRENSRSLIFIYQTQGQRTPRIHSVVDPL